MARRQGSPGAGQGAAGPIAVAASRGATPEELPADRPVEAFPAQQVRRVARAAAHLGLEQGAGAVGAPETLLGVPALPTGQDDIPADGLATQVAVRDRSGLLDVILAAKVAPDPDVVVEGPGAHRTLKAAAVEILIVGCDAVVGDVATAAGAQRSEQLQVIGTAVNLAVVLESVASAGAAAAAHRAAVLLGGFQLAAAGRAEEAVGMEYITLHPDGLGRGNGPLAFAALAAAAVHRGQVVVSAVGRAIQLVVASVFEAGVAYLAAKVLRVKKLAECLDNVARGDALAALVALLAKL